MNNEHDVIIIGGGINGAGIARDCALRGIKAALFEKHDIAHGASGNNTGMIHGGIRYLRYDVNTTKESCTDSGYILRICPHLLFRVPFIFPVLKGDANGQLLLEGAEIFFEAYDAFQPLKGGKKHTRLSKEEVLGLEPGLTKKIIGAVTMDEWGIDAHRLTLNNVIQAQELGTLVKTYSPLTEFIYDNKDAVCGARIFNRLDKKFENHYAPVVINATGAWGPRIAAMSKMPYRLRQGKGIHVVLSHRVSNYGMVMKGVDGRQMFFLPHENNTVIGTTDDDYYSDLDAPRVLEDEVKYVMQAARNVFPKIDKYRKSFSYAGVRPTIFSWGKNEDKLSREHNIIDHGADGMPGLLSVSGGKLAAFRQLSEEVTNIVAEHVCNHSPCSTHTVPLPGAEEKLHVPEWTNQYNVTQLAVSRMAYRHGSRTQKILNDIQKNPRLKDDTCLCEPVLEAEIVHACHNENPGRLHDLCARTKLGKGLCGGAHCLARSSQVFAREKNLSAPEQLEELENALEKRFEARHSALQSSNLASEELNQSIHYLSGNLSVFMAAAKQELGLEKPYPGTHDPADSSKIRPSSELQTEELALELPVNA